MPAAVSSFKSKYLEAPILNMGFENLFALYILHVGMTAECMHKDIGLGGYVSLEMPVNFQVSKSGYILAECLQCGQLSMCVQLKESPCCADHHSF